MAAHHMHQPAPTWGTSFSVKYCRELGLDWQEVFRAALTELHIKRFRLMSYWDEIEPRQGDYDFGVLDRQFELAKKYGAVITLCLGARQPRWPETHLPRWITDNLQPTSARRQPEWSAALLRFIEATVQRYAHHPVLVSWQLENEALNRSFGMHGNFARQRLKQELHLVHQLDKAHPVIMSTSNAWGLPLRAPKPDIYGFSLYRSQYHHGYHTSHLPASWYRLRALLIKATSRRDSFIHELQLEPWGPAATHTLSLGEQDKSMSITQFHKNIAFAQRTSLSPIDCWGLEWWFWRKQQGDDRFWEAAKPIFNSISDV